MTESVSRPELDAKLDALRQEMRADSAALRGDFERLRGDFATIGAGINQSVATLAVSLSTVGGDVRSLSTRVDGLERRLDEVNGSVSAFKWWLAGAVVSLFIAIYTIGPTIQQLTVATFQAAVQQQKDVQPTPQPAAPVINVYPAAPASGAK